MRIRTRHPACGEVVVVDLPDDHPLEAGAALHCPACGEVWWHFPQEGEIQQPDRSASTGLRGGPRSDVPRTAGAYRDPRTGRERPAPLVPPADGHAGNGHRPAGPVPNGNGHRSNGHHANGKAAGAPRAPERPVEPAPPPAALGPTTPKPPGSVLGDESRYVPGPTGSVLDVASGRAKDLVVSPHQRVERQLEVRQRSERDGDRHVPIELRAAKDRHWFARSAISLVALLVLAGAVAWFATREDPRIAPGARDTKRTEGAKPGPQIAGAPTAEPARDLTDAVGKPAAAPDVTGLPVPDPVRVEKTPAPTPTAVTTPAPLPRSAYYRLRRPTYTILIPKSWRVDEAPGFVGAYIGTQNRAGISIFSEEDAEKVSLQELTDAALRDVTLEGFGARRTKPERVRIGRHEGRRVVSTLPGGDRREAYVLKDGNISHTIQVEIKASATNDERTAVPVIVESFSVR